MIKGEILSGEGRMSWKGSYQATLRRFIVVLTAFTLLLPASAFAQEKIRPSERVRSNVAVREEPLGPPSRRVGTLLPGENAELLDSVPYFYRVRLSNGVEGYVSKSWTARLASPAALAATRPLSIHFMDVGQGDGTLIVCPNGSTILIDSGSLSGRSPDDVRDYLWKQIEPVGGDIDYLIVTHPDADHYNLLPEVLDEISIGQAWYVADRADYADKELYDWLNATPAKAKRLTAEYFDAQAKPNPDINCGSAKVWILAAAVEHPASRKNAMSIVVMVRLGDFEAVITGDATHATENMIMSRYPAAWLDIDVLRAGHHGSLTTSTSKVWADTLTPTSSIFSNGYENSFGHPRAEVVARLEPHAKTVAAHKFRDALRQTSGREYTFTDRDTTKAIYTTSMSRTIVVRSSGQGYETVLGQ
ncbi:MBL fold metallo-hydrolase [Sphingomonas crocodyli]|uniref:MBL fold metallo-hydrolase n=1 Tax=Sphingomonas crocodyli TaxID=1979270 RepID=A0A437M7A4_9SPHN|nr:MBL fold metallo-hydrolase [Sphingomonas crocodyli]RVT93483.1 MBL fold metallo-hydrolase [Sphingomonas crocodyli]